MSDTRSDLSSENKISRKRALQALIQQTSTTNPQELFTTYQVQILKCFRDESETCRELSLQLTLAIIQKLNLNDYYLAYVFPVVVERIGTPEIVEESEELRLKTMELVNEIVGLYNKEDLLGPFVDDIVEVLTHSLNDKYPKVKLACCDCVHLTFEAAPRKFGEVSVQLVKPLVRLFTHRHFKVRVAAVEALGVVIMASRGALDDSVVPLAERLFDQVPQVRRSVITVSSKLLLDYQDRYSYFYKLLPLILTGLCDDVEETRALAERLWHQVGEKYARENEKELKDEIDYCYDQPGPSIGCRALVRTNCTKILAGLRGEFRHAWQEDVLVRSGQLLQALAEHSSMTMNLGEILPDVISACRRGKGRAVDAISRAAQALGEVVPGPTWWKILQEVLSSPPVHTGHVCILLALLKGCKDLSEIGNDVSDMLAEPHVSRVSSTCSPIVLQCCEVLLNAPLGEDARGKLVVCCLSLLAMSREALDAAAWRRVLEECWWSVEDPQRVVRGVLGYLQGDPASWTAGSPDRRVFDAVLGNAPNIDALPWKNLMRVLERLLRDGSDVPGRLATFTTLAKCLQSWDEDGGEFYEALIKEVVAPGLVWRAGRGNEALRALATKCLGVILQNHSTTAPQLVPPLVTLLEDPTRHTRYFAAKCLSKLTPVQDVSTLIKVYQPLLDKIDDECELVRFEAVTAVKKLFEILPDDFDQKTFEPHLKHAVEVLLVHMDEDDDELKTNLLGKHPLPPACDVAGREKKFCQQVR